MSRFIMIMTVLLLMSAVAFPFGKNKIIYHEYDWMIVESPHFKIYMSSNDLHLTNLIVSTAEEIFNHHTNSFRFSPSNRIKIMLYRTQIDFQQNNISDGVGQGTGGFTEFLKGRVVLPYSANYEQFRHILSHELTHAFQIYFWGNGQFSYYAVVDVDIPLWVIEGGAEYNSIGLDNECEMMMADGVINGILPSLMELSDLSRLRRTDYYYVYKEGQAFYHYMTKQYGEGIFADFNDSIRAERSFKTVVSNIFETDLETLNARFFDFLRNRYLPEISNLVNMEAKAKKVIPESSYFNMNPVLLNPSNIAFISSRMIYPSILLYNLSNGYLERLVKGGFDEDFLEFSYHHNNHLSVSSNQILCFVSRSGGKNALQLMDLTNRRVQKIDLDFDDVLSPEISRDGERILFSGVTESGFGIYVHHIPSGKTEKLTENSFYYNQPRWLDKERIVFTSNLKNGYKSGENDIVIFNTQTRKIEAIFDSGFSDDDIAVSPDGNQIAFISGSIHPSLYVYDRKKNRFYLEIVPTGGVFSPSFMDDKRLLLTVYHKNSYNIYEYTLKLTNTVTNVAVMTNFVQTNPHLRFSPSPITLSSYGLELSLDAMFVGMSLNSAFGFGAFGLLAMSDILNDHRFQLLMDSVIRFEGNIFDYLNVDFIYLNLKYRHNFGFRIFHYSNYFYEFSTFQNFFDMEKSYKTTFGFLGLYSYPLTTFDRIDVNIGIHGFSYQTNASNQNEFLSRNILSVSYVHDSTLWDMTGPVDGVRYEAILSKSFPFYEGSLDYLRMVLDYRAYLLLFPGYSLAFRAAAGMIFGPDKDKNPFYVGGFNSIRGYDLWSYNGDSMFVMNLEFRFPFIPYWAIGFPLPIQMPTIWGAFFIDLGSAFNLGQSYEPWRYEGDIFYFRDLKVGVGFGLRLVILTGIKLMVDWSTPYDGYGLPEFSKWKTYWMIGVDF